VVKTLTVTKRLVGNQVSLHGTKRIPSRLLRDDFKHEGIFEDGMEQQKNEEGSFEEDRHSGVILRGKRGSDRRWERTGEFPVWDSRDH
jgi:hypothetical protein